ncbi:hypothetical protein GCM10025882_28450 [Acinetobacter gyllenbergii]|uniref:ABC transporter ATP-binding protein n=1 Tax=Acinetobacter gyllenbergii CIP 110306 = MTCC 11365 TaxID=1217657 RepID=A0A829HHZ6_9GAMM|nr:ABC transporter ATP-binding protein [Acinetobacter gyllenbergii]EPF88078.1 hypothetical protein F957_01365 [Acinetobacter gyllenbergii CIP 110306 = MTCC 11365]EPH35846.1 Putative ATP-binding protein [Acinetobacter gyllenbergii CIP 110306 = MTCC 11365]GMA12420.1 hypothetical protein GCM10025882_28450 [Acinetobacter gyllenbergii]
MSINSKFISTMLMYIFNKLLKNSKKEFLIIFLVMIVSSSIVVYIPYLFSNIIDGLSVDTLKVSSLYIFVAYAILLGLSLFFQNSINYLAAIIAEKVKFFASISFFKKIVYKNSNFFINHNAAEIQSTQIKGSDAVNTITQLFVMIFFPCILQLFFSLYLIGKNIDPIMVLVVFLYGIFFIGFTFFSNIWIRKYLSNAVEQGQLNANLAGNAILNIENLKYFNSSNWMYNKFKFGAGEVLDNWRKYCIKRISYSLVYGVALTIQFIIFFLIILPKFELGLITIGNIVLFNALLLQLNKPFEMVGLSIESLIRSFSELKPFAVMWSNDKNDRLFFELKKEVDFTNNVIEFKNVSYKYDNGRGINNLSFKTESNKLNFIVGPSGIGKSTILKILLKNIELFSGKVLVGGIDIVEVDEFNLYSSVSVVPQDILLLNDTLKSNIVLGRDYNDGIFYRVIKLASIEHLIFNMPDGIETKLGERGLSLSGGERQRIALARALYGEPKFLLLDEASSSLDFNTEKEIIENLRTYCKDITILAITHRLSIIREDDHIIKLG